MKKFHLLPLFLLASFIVFGQSFNRSITKVNINGSDYTSFPINYATTNNSPLSVTVFFTYQKTDDYNHSYVGGKFFINNANVNSFTVPNLDNNQPWHSSVSSLSVPINNINSLDLKVRITTQAPDSPHPTVRDYDTSTVRINVQKPISNNTISAPQETYNYSSNLSITLTGSQPTGGNGNYSYQWYKKRWDETSFNIITGATGKNFTTSISENTLYYRKVTSGTLTTNSNNFQIKVVHSLDKVNNTAIGHGNIGPIYSPPPLYNNGNYTETVEGVILAGDSFYCTGFTPYIETFPRQNASVPMIYQWQKKTSSTDWVNILGATNAQLTTPALFEETYFRRVITSEHFSSHRYSNSIKVTINNNLPPNEISYVNVSIPMFSGTNMGGYEQTQYTWYTGCIGDRSSSTRLPSNEIIGNPFPPEWGEGGAPDTAHAQSLPIYVFESSPKPNCQNGYVIARKVIKNNSISYSNVLNYYPSSNKSGKQSDINVLSNNQGDILFHFNSFYNQVVDIYISNLNNGKTNKILQFKVEENHKQPWRFTNNYQKGIYNYKIVSNGEVIKSGNIYNK